jgi:hypothetical protein
MTAEPDTTAGPRYHIHSGGDEYSIYGVDAIWHNQYKGPKSDFSIMRTTYECDINALILMVSKHVEQGHYSIISLNATPHMLVVVCGMEKKWADLPKDMFHRPSDENNRDE